MELTIPFDELMVEADNGKWQKYCDLVAEIKVKVAYHRGCFKKFPLSLSGNIH